MTSDTDTLTFIQRALDQMTAVIEAIPAGLAGAPTPCPDWDVRALVRHVMLRPEFRGPGQAFGPEVPVPPDAPVYDRLAGWFGRDPAWTPGPGAAGRP